MSQARFLLLTEDHILFMGVAINRFWLCPVVLGFKSHKTGRDFFKEFGMPLWGIKAMPPSMKADFYL
ncbi:hypothetical protein QNH14_11070 [Apirhabdus apintestini]|nr:hypothetical protein QNH14_11070 [Enterobacteriaceae bacterium CA-0114]